MARGIFVLGTDTSVGKTVVSAGLTYLLLTKGYSTCYFKPVSSGIVIEGENFIPGDARFVKTVSGLDECDYNITPYCFKTPVSPHLASRIENISVNVDSIKEKFRYLKSKYEFIITEGCGGLIVPLTDNGYMIYHLVRDLGIGCIIVARAGLGTINHTVLTVRYAQSVGIEIKGIIINGYIQSLCHDDNIETIKKLANIPVIGIIPAMDDIDVGKLQAGNLKEIFKSTINLQDILEIMNYI